MRVAELVSKAADSGSDPVCSNARAGHQGFLGGYRLASVCPDEETAPLRPCVLCASVSGLSQCEHGVSCEGEEGCL